MQVSRHKVITKLLKITLKFIINCFLSMNLQRTLKALGGIGGVDIEYGWSFIPDHLVQKGIR